MKKRNTFIHSLNEKGFDRRRSAGWFAFFPLLFVLVGALLACEAQNRTEFQSKENAPPVITSVQLLPANPHIGNDLNVIVQCQDPDGDPISYEYQWFRNDQEMYGEKSALLKTGNFRKGDTIRVRISASDGKSTGEPVLSSPIRVLNSPPLIEEVLIEPRLAHGTDQLKAVVKAIDRDGDPIYYLYQWELNGVALPEEKEETLGQGRSKKGDSVTVVVTPDDREVLGTPKRSELVRISNSPPLIVSSPPLSIEGNIYLYQVRADEPDQDPVAFSLKLGPKGMGIDRETGLIRWEIRQEDKGTHSIEVEASDPEGAKSLQRYSLAVEFR